MDMARLSPLSSCLFQYIADLLLCSPSFSDKLLDATSLLNFLSSRGYHLTPSKTQFSFPQVNYLKFSLTPTYGYFTLNHLAHLCSLSLPPWPVSSLMCPWYIPYTKMLLDSSFFPSSNNSLSLFSTAGAHAYKLLLQFLCSTLILTNPGSFLITY